MYKKKLNFILAILYIYYEFMFIKKKSLLTVTHTVKPR